MIETLVAATLNKAVEAAWKTFAEERARRRIDSRDNVVELLRDFAGGLPTSIDERLEKIERARIGLQEAAAAVAELEALREPTKLV